MHALADLTLPRHPTAFQYWVLDEVRSRTVRLCQKLGVIREDRMTLLKSGEPRALTDESFRFLGNELYCPIQPRLHARFEQADREALDWVWHFELVPDRSSLEHFASLRITELICRAYPEAELDRLRIVMDWSLWVFLTDDHLDESMIDLDRLQSGFEVYKSILRGESDDSYLNGHARALADLRRRIALHADAACVRRFVEYASGWFDSLLWEATNRLEGVRPTVHQYMRMREITVGMYTEYALFDVTHNVRTDEAFWTDPDLLYLKASTANLIAWSNDVFSYAKEARIEDPHNLPRLLEDQCGFVHESAVTRVIEMYNKEMLRFVESEKQLRQRATESLHVDHFVNMLKGWIRANLDWSYRSTRYGLDGIEREHSAI